MIELAAGDYRLDCDPARGGSIMRFEWRGDPLLRAVCGPSIFDVACFPLVPFSNRIANGRFTWNETDVTIAPNMPGHPHPLHGFGWLAEWQAKRVGATSALLVHDYPGGEWPWPYRAEQVIELGEDGLRLSLSLTNLSGGPMPAGLGFHPYFPRMPATLFHGLHSGEWLNNDECLPMELVERRTPQDWWEGQPVGTREVDTAYTGRNGALTILWPERRLKLVMDPGPELGMTVVYTPANADYFCIEPVSHSTDAVNHSARASGLWCLAPGASRKATVRLAAASLTD
jgi:aldose 1-epimerase